MYDNVAEVPKVAFVVDEDAVVEEEEAEFDEGEGRSGEKHDGEMYFHCGYDLVIDHVERGVAWQGSSFGGSVSQCMFSDADE